MQKNCQPLNLPNHNVCGFSHSWPMVRRSSADGAYEFRNWFFIMILAVDTSLDTEIIDFMIFLGISSNPVYLSVLSLTRYLQLVHSGCDKLFGHRWLVDQSTNRFQQRNDYRSRLTIHARSIFSARWKQSDKLKKSKRNQKVLDELLICGYGFNVQPKLHEMRNRIVHSSIYFFCIRITTLKLKFRWHKNHDHRRYNLVLRVHTVVLFCISSIYVSLHLTWLGVRGTRQKR
jgi:hypothetical protein